MTHDRKIRDAESVLMRRRAALRQSVDDELSQLSPGDSSRVRDDLDKAVDDEFQALATNLAEMESRELGRVEHALRRLQDGKYGICEQCDRRIPVARLKVIPYATTCVNCQRQAETSQRISRFAEHWEQVNDGHDDDELDRFDIQVDFAA